MQQEPRSGPGDSSRAVTSTSLRRSRARSASTGRWPGVRIEPHHGARCHPGRLGQRMGPETLGAPPSGAQMPWWSSAGHGSIAPTGPRSRASVLTWSSRWTCRASRGSPGGARSSRTPVRSPRRPFGAWRVMPESRGSSPWAPPSRLTWAAGPLWFPQGCAGPCAQGRRLSVPRVWQTPVLVRCATTSSTGPTVVPPPWRTSCCSAVPITVRCTKGSVWR